MVLPRVMTFCAQWWWVWGRTGWGGSTSITVPCGTAEPMMRGCCRTCAMWAEPWERMDAVPVLNPVLVVCIALGMKAEIIPDWLLTGIIWQMIWEVGQRVAVVVIAGVAGWVLTLLGAVRSILSIG